MKALTLWQPWASFVAHGLKVYETRSWDTKYRGWLAIHAASRIPREVVKLCQEEPFSTWLERLNYTVETLPLGVVVCKAHLLRTFRTGSERVSEFDQQFGDFSPWRFGWELGVIVSYKEPIKARGRQGLWDWTEPEGADGQKYVKCTCGQRAYHWHDPSCPVYKEFQSEMRA